jgi:L-aspartate oxidase
VTDTSVARAIDAVDARLLAAPDPAAVARVRDVLTSRVGVLRTADGLRSALDELQMLAAPDAGGQIAAVARMVATAALAHGERRGAHWRTDSHHAVPTAPPVVVTAPGRSEPNVALQVAADSAVALAS